MAILGRVGMAWGRLSLRWKLVLLNGLVVAVAGGGVLMLTHRVSEPFFMNVMHDAAAQPTTQAGQQTYDAAVDRQVIPAVVIAAGAALALNFVVITLALRPLRQVEAATRRLAAGDVGVRIGSRRRDEIGTVAGSFDEMAHGLETAEALRRQVTDDVAHELRTPVHNLLGLIEAMRDGVIAADPAGLDRAHAQVSRLAGLVEDLRSLADAHSARDHLRLGPVRLAALAREVVRSFEGVVGARRLEAVVLPPPGGEVEVEADADRIAQVIRNLVANALRYADEGTTVSVRVAPEAAGAVRVAVGDSGEPIPDAVLPRVFERFVRADPSRGRGSGGAGIGLAVVRELVEAHGGSVGASSTGREVEVWFSLPARRPSRAEAGAPSGKFVPLSAQTTASRGGQGSTVR